MATTRKLAAIAFIDVVGFTTMMGKDEQATLRLLEHLRTTLYPLVKSHGGLVLKELGDGFLLNFNSALDAVYCSMELQRSVTEVPSLRLRIGIHLGDVVVEEKDILGSGVNVAARVQSLAAPGGIAITEDVWKQVKNQSELSFSPLGLRKLKGVSTAVRVFSIKSGGLAIPHIRERIMAHRSFKPSMVGLGIIVFALLSYLFVPEVRQLTAGEVPSIAILYLKNLGPESDEPYTYGITQDLIVDVAKAGFIRVSPMKDILSFQKTDLPIEKIAEQLRVRYVLEGSLRREAHLFNLTVQIVEAATGKTLLAERIQTTISEAAALQGKLAETILNALDVKPSPTIAQAITKTHATNPEAYEFYLRGKYLFDKKKTKEDVAIARGLFDRAIALDSPFVGARVGLGKTYELEGDYEQASNIYEIALSRARRNNDKVEEAVALYQIGGVQLDMGEYSKAVDYLSKSLELSQQLKDHDGEVKALNVFGIVHKHLGDFPPAIDYFSKGLSLARTMGYRRLEGVILMNIGTVHHTQGELETARDHYLNALSILEDLEDYQASALLQSNIGVVYQGLGDYAKALEYHNRTLKMSRDLGDPRGEWSALLNIGVVYDEQGNFTKAMEHYLMGLRIAEQLGDKRNESQALLDIGTIYEQQEEAVKALEFFKRSLSIRQELGDKPGEAETLGFMGILFARQEKWTKAIEVLTTATTFFTELEQAGSFTRFDSWLVYAMGKSGHQDSIERRLSRLEGSLASMSKSSYNYTEILLNISRTYSLLGNSQKSSRYLEQAYHLMNERARKIAEPSARQMYLNNLRTHREIIAARTELGQP